MTKKKSLQKFTDFSTIKTLEDFQDLFDADPKEHSACIDWLRSELNKELAKSKHEDTTSIDKYFNRYEKAISVNGYGTSTRVEEIKEEFKNQRWTVNEQLIIVALHDFTKEYLRTPTVIELAQTTGLSRTTVHKHLVNSDITKSYKQENKEILFKLRDKALSLIYAIGVRNSDVKTLVKFAELTDVKESKSIKNYIQINNTKIDNHFLENLPTEAQRQIEEIILLNQ